MLNTQQLWRQPSDRMPGLPILSEHIIRTGSFPENVMHELQDGKQAGSRHRLANSYVNASALPGELQLVDGHKVSGGLPASPLAGTQLPPPVSLGGSGALCQVQLASPRGGTAGRNGCSSPSKSSVLGAVPPPQLSQRALFEAARDQMLAEGDDLCSFSPLSPGCVGTSRKLQELFGLFRDESLARPGSQTHDALLSQVAAEAESGELDDLGDPSELHDLVSTESALTEVGGLTADFPPITSAPLSVPFSAAAPYPQQLSVPLSHQLPPPLSLSLSSGGLSPQRSASAAGPAAPPAFSAAAGMLPLDASQQHHLERAATLAPPIHTTQIVMAPRAASVPEVPRLPPHLATGPPSPKRRPGAASTASGRHSGLEVADGGVGKRSGAGRKAEDDARAQEGTKPKPKRTSGERRPRRMTCNYCKTHVTPQWRCGPDGPRTLCNACGVRWGKGKLELNGATHH